MKELPFKLPFSNIQFRVVDTSIGEVQFSSIASEMLCFQQEMVRLIQRPRLHSVGALPPDCISSRAVVARSCHLDLYKRNSDEEPAENRHHFRGPVLLVRAVRLRFTFCQLAYCRRLLIVPNADTFRCACSLIFK